MSIDEAPAEPRQPDGLTGLAEGLYAYLQEVTADRDLCRRHEATIAVQQLDGELRLARCFENSSRTVSHLAGAIRLLPRWRTPRGRKGGEGERPPGTHDVPCLLRSDIDWECRRHLVQAQIHPLSEALSVKVSVFPWECELQQLPLRTIATALRCHEFLVPEGTALPLPVPGGDGRATEGIRAYLARTMPPNAYASQCI